MKIALVAHNIMGGDGQSTTMYALAKHAVEQGHSVSLVANYVAPELVKAGCKHIFIPLKFQRPHLFKVWEFAKRVDAWARREGSGFDVVHAVGFSLTVPHTVNTCQFVHGAWLRSGANRNTSISIAYAAYQRTYTLVNARWEQRAFAAARNVVAVSERVQAELMALGLRSPSIRVIPNGVDIGRFYHGAEDRERFGLPLGVTLFLFSGDIRTPRKNLDTVLAALERLPDSVHLVVAADAKSSPFVGMATEKGIAHRVHFIGFRKDLPVVMRAVDAFVFPSRYEACALVLLEAAASGLPIITARSTGGSEFLSRESGYFMDDPNDSEQLAEFMRNVAGSSDLREQMGKAARASAEKCSWKRVCGDYMELYAQTLSTANA